MPWSRTSSTTSASLLRDAHLDPPALAGCISRRCESRFCTTSSSRAASPNTRTGASGRSTTTVCCAPAAGSIWRNSSTLWATTAPRSTGCRSRANCPRCSRDTSSNCPTSVLRRSAWRTIVRELRMELLGVRAGSCRRCAPAAPGHSPAAASAACAARARRSRETACAPAAPPRPPAGPARRRAAAARAPPPPACAR